MSDLARDTRYALRQLRRSPVFTAVACATLALGVGANTLAFSVLYGTVLRSLPFRDPSRLVLLRVERLRANHPTERFAFTYGQYAWLRDQATPFERLADYSSPGVNLSGEGTPERASIEVVAASYFATLGVAPSLGRTFLEEEDAEPGASPVAVISDGLWRRRFGAAPDIIGRELRANGVPLRIVGVMPPGFGGVSGRAQAWIPNMMGPGVTFDRHLTSNDTFHQLVARIRAGVDQGTLAANLGSLAMRLRTAVPLAESADGADALRLLARPLGDAGIDPARRRSSVVLFGAAWLVLAVACVNLAALQLGRSRVRARELALRAALGARPSRLVRQSLVENMLLVVAGCALGVALALIGARLMHAAVPERLPTPGNLYAQISEFASTPLNTPVLFFGVVIALLTGMGTSLVPALRAVRRDVSSDLKAGANAVSGERLSMLRPGALALLSAGQIALAVVLTVGAALLLRSFANAQGRSPGFDPSHVVTFRINPPDVRFSTSTAPARVTPVLERVQALPEVEAATVSMCTPFMATCGRRWLFVVGRDADADHAPTVGVHYVAPDHFRTLRIPLLMGRPFDAYDRAGSPSVAIINATGAKRLWPGESAIGKRIVLGSPAAVANPDSVLRIVGVVGDVTYWPPEEPAGIDVYTPYTQFTYSSTFVIARTRGAPATAIPALREALRQLDRDLPLEDMRTMEQRAGLAVAGRRFVAVVLGGFAVLALCLTLVGVYGMVSCTFAQRRREIGVRMALGSTPARAVRLLLGEGAVLVGAGTLLGVTLALVFTRVLRGLLSGVSATDPATLIGVALSVIVAALAAVFTPARRAVRIDPMTILRGD